MNQPNLMSTIQNKSNIVDWLSYQSLNDSELSY
jgi:hypothetical protein